MVAEQWKYRIMNCFLPRRGDRRCFAVASVCLLRESG